MDALATSRYEYFTFVEYILLFFDWTVRVIVRVYYLKLALRVCSDDNYIDRDNESVCYICYVATYLYLLLKLTL